MIQTLIRIGCAVLMATCCLCRAQTITPKTHNAHHQDSTPLPMAEIRALAAVYNDIRRYYVDPIDDKVIFKNAIRGMVNALDPHSDFIDGEAFSALEESITGAFGGIGIEIKTDGPGMFIIAAVLPHTPAERAHLLPGDHIVKLNNTLTATMTLNEIVKALRGPQRSLIRITVIRPHRKTPITVLVSRDLIAVDHVTIQWAAPHYLWIRINEFQENTLAQMVTALNALDPHAISGIILDLRNNPGGLLSTAIDVCSVFLAPKKLVVFTKNTHHPEQIQHYYTHSMARLLPKAQQHMLTQSMIVLVNNGSASAAEIVAGALKDHHRAVIMGSRTFGKGTVQTTFPIKYLKNTLIKLTTARYYTPLGYAIQERGIAPDIDLTGNLPPLPIYENNLGRHLKNDQGMTTRPQASQNIQIHVEPATTPGGHHDHALQEAVRLLQTWSLFRQQVTHDATSFPHFFPSPNT